MLHRLYKIADETLFQEYSSILGATVLAVTVYFTLKKQSENIREQICAQQLLEEERIKRVKIEEICNVAAGLRRKMLLIDGKIVEDVTQDVDDLNCDLDKITMLYNLYRVIDRELFVMYKESVDQLIRSWSILHKKMDIKEDQYTLYSAYYAYQYDVEEFLCVTDRLIEHLSLIGKDDNVAIVW